MKAILPMTLFLTLIAPSTYAKESSYSQSQRSSNTYRPHNIKRASNIGAQIPTTNHSNMATQGTDSQGTFTDTLAPQQGFSTFTAPYDQSKQTAQGGYGYAANIKRDSRGNLISEIYKRKANRERRIQETTTVNRNPTSGQISDIIYLAEQPSAKFETINRSPTSINQPSSEQSGIIEDYAYASTGYINFKDKYFSHCSNRKAGPNKKSGSFNCYTMTPATCQSQSNHKANPSDQALNFHFSAMSSQLGQSPYAEIPRQIQNDLPPRESREFQSACDIISDNFENRPYLNQGTRIDPPITNDSSHSQAK